VSAVDVQRQFKLKNAVVAERVQAARAVPHTQSFPRKKLGWQKSVHYAENYVN
jgi:hypothetical protein